MYFSITFGIVGGRADASQDVLPSQCIPEARVLRRAFLRRVEATEASGYRGPVWQIRPDRSRLTSYAQHIARSPISSRPWLAGTGPAEVCPDAGPRPPGKGRRQTARRPPRPR